ncbi:putative protease YhbU precursor [Rubripirellula obstinata]|uniref:Putative protease YhbU n=1 Tax=Rubripirellula obstinata TaxID=406547 RepID=A0A5B1CLU8_9BACT|nr:U32 family peptidase [Rubripirellula obstinata]KAA1262058.1 putative protease YhbU precursor [Rubripirellula obstinata]
MNSNATPSPSKSPGTPPASSPIELLSPAGDWRCATAAIENGADAIYFGLDCGFNARHRATNFGLADLPQLGQMLRRRGVRGYATMNTLVFPSEMPPLVETVKRIAEAGIDAVLVQDFGVARIVREVCPELEIHASTQMSLTSAETIAVAERLGLSRVVLARELSIAEIRKIASATDMPLEVFIHGALCVAYSGQCLTSESLGGRSANRGQCAQACRLPYELIVDNEDRPLDDVKYLLSPQDLAGYAAIPDLIDTGVASIKIEGRLKTPEYVANITRHYRSAIDEAVAKGTVTVSEQSKREMELSFSRGFSPGWLEGNDHKRLVPGLQNSKRGIELGRILDFDKDRIELHVAAPLALGDGLAIETGQDSQNEAQKTGGRIYELIDSSGVSCKNVPAGVTVWVGFGRDEINWSLVDVDQVVFKNDDPKLNRRLRQTYEVVDPTARQTIDMTVTANVGQPLQVVAKLGRGIEVSASGDTPLDAANKRPIEESILREKLGRLGGTPFELGQLIAHVDGGPMVPMKMLNDVRRELVGQLESKLSEPPKRSINVLAGESLLQPIASEQAAESVSPQLSVLCRTEEQIEAACKAGADYVYVDLHDVRRYAAAVQIARGHGVPIAIGTVRMQKPGEMGLLKVLHRHRPDAILARNLAAMEYFRESDFDVFADFSLNVANHRSAQWIRDSGASRITASYDLNRDQLMDLIDSLPSSWMEVVIHQHMPMFHMEHCVFCSVMSPGTNKTNCGRPCDDHIVQLRDRVGAEHPLQADVACRNTLYNATAQSGAEITSDLVSAGVRWFRVELLEEKASDAKRTIELYQRLIAGQIGGHEVWKQLDASNRVGVTRGTLETKRNPLAIL